MAEYTDLINTLRDFWNDGTESIRNEAADAIEELQAAKCPHFIRNIHDRGDDSLCEKWRCEVKEVAPVRHGRWIWDEDGMDWNIGAWRCSECKAMSPMWWNTNKTSPMNKSGHRYCPNCGARLDLEGDKG